MGNKPSSSHQYNRSNNSTLSQNNHKSSRSRNNSHNQNIENLNSISNQNSPNRNKSQSSSSVPQGQNFNPQLLTSALANEPSPSSNLNPNPKSASKNSLNSNSNHSNDRVQNTPKSQSTSSSNSRKENASNAENASGDQQNKSSNSINIGSPGSLRGEGSGGEMSSFLNMLRGAGVGQARSNTVGGSTSQDSQTNEISNFFQQIFSSPTSSSTSDESRLSNFFSTSRSSRSQNNSSHMALPNSHRVRILERNGVRFAYINGRLIPIAAEAKVCQYCDKKINPLTEDYEIHVVKCMTKPRVKYNTFELTDESKHQDLLGEECTICFEEFNLGDMLARLECFCVFHKACLDNWLSRKQCCPLHYHLDEEDEKK